MQKMRKHCKNFKKIALELSENSTNQYSHKKGLIFKKNVKMNLQTKNS